MNLKLLKIFVALYDTRSFTRAAERCFMTQPAVSTGLKGLERELGTVLFQRDAGGVEATGSAERLYPKAVRLLDQVEGLSQIGTMTGKNQLTLGLQTDLCPRRIHHILLAIRARMPGVLLHLVRPGEECDLRIAAKGETGEQERFAPLWRESYPLWVDPALLASGRPIAIISTEVDKLSRQQGGEIAFNTSRGTAIQLDRHRDAEIQVREFVRAGYGAARLASSWVEAFGLAELSGHNAIEVEIGVIAPITPRSEELSQLLQLLAELNLD